MMECDMNFRNGIALIVFIICRLIFNKTNSVWFKINPQIVNTVLLINNHLTSMIEKNNNKFMQNIFILKI